MDIIGEDYWEGDEPQNEQKEGADDFTSQLSTKDMQHIREGISCTVRPTWHEGPPQNLGQPAHGKLKADQWRSTIEFDLPVSLMRLLVTEKANKLPEERIQKRELQVKSTILLAMAIRWGTSHRTSSQHAAEYKRYMVEYLHSLRELRPDKDLRPNHHFAVHNGDDLPEQGPMHGWWVYVFERLIGILQKINTNHKIGEFIVSGYRRIPYQGSTGQLEITMLKAFCAASNIKAFVHQPGCPPILKQCADFMAECFGNETRGTLMNDIRTFEGLKPPEHSIKRKDRKTVPLEEELFRALSEMSVSFSEELPGWRLCNKVELLPRHTIRGVHFANFNTTARNSLVFFKPTPDATAIPGVIRQIFIVDGEEETEHHLLAIHRYLPPTVPNPFVYFQDFGAGIWSKQLAENVEIVPVFRRLAHAIQREWDCSHYVMKSLDRVSVFKT